MTGYAKHIQPRNLDLIPEAKMEQIGTAGPLTIWEVDGKYVRDKIYIDFTTGGNSHADTWMPPNEIWIDNESDTERDFDLIHELSEYNFMATGMTYDHAHDLASGLELEARANPERFQELWQREVDKLTARDSTMGSRLLTVAKSKNSVRIQG